MVGSEVRNFKNVGFQIVKKYHFWIIFGKIEEEKRHRIRLPTIPECTL